MKIHLSLIAVIFFVTGCVSREAMLVNPQTGQTYNCNASGWGWFGAPHAAHMFNKCVSTMRSNGYKYPYEVPNNQQQPPLVQNNNVTQPTAIIKPKISNVSEAKAAYKNGQITKDEYNSTISQLKSEYEKKLQQIKSEFNAGNFNELEYKKRLAVAKIDYAG